MKSQIMQDCEAGYTLRQAIHSNVARDPITQRDLRTIESNGWRVSGKMRKTLKAANEAAASLPEKCQ